MTIRLKLLIFFILTLLLLTGIGLYAVGVYRETLNDERQITRHLQQHIELSYKAESLFRSELNAWKSVLLRGPEANNYHHYLQNFYQTERDTRKAITHLQAIVSEEPEVLTLTEKLKTAHHQMGLKLREALQVFNATQVNAAQVTNQYVIDVEKIPTELLNKIITRLQLLYSDQLSYLTEHREQQEKILLTLFFAVVAFSMIIFLWLIDKNIARPAERATYLANIINNAQMVARFGTWDWELSKDMHFWSDGLYTILGLDKSIKPSLEHYIATLHEDDRKDVQLVIQNATRDHSSFEVEARIRLSDDIERVVQQRGQVSRSGKDGDLRMTSIIYDITERKQSEQRLAYLANYDTLTGLPNRYLFQDRLTHAMAQAERKNQQVALLFLDLDHFKSVNDALGHPAGDELLIQAAERIREHLREGDTAARLGGDEFTIIIEQFENCVQVASVARNVLKALNKHYQIGSHEVFVSASIGITYYPNDGLTADTLLKNADTAMYLAKDQGRNNYYFFTKELNLRAQERLLLENALRMALKRDEFQLNFQPQIELASGRIIGAEVLLRWTNDQTPISPTKFIPILEETGLIVPVGQWILEQACQTAKHWQQKGFKDCRIAVNLSARQLRQESIVEDIKGALLNSGLAHHYLEIELTESSLIESSHSNANLQSLEQLGVTLAIDDFGTGYSSLSYLQQYSVDVLKIDRSFIKDINKDSNDNAITSAIVSLARQLDIKVVAEGVETSDQLEFLQKLQCDQVQGYLIGRPMPKPEFEKWLKSHQNDKTGLSTWNFTEDTI